METKSKGWEAIQRKNLKLMGYWTGGWVLTSAIATFGPKFLWSFNFGISILAVLINTIIGVGWILINRKYTNGLDELQRKVAVDAKAIALGVGVVGGLSYSMLNTANVISFHAEIGHLVMLMGITYFIAFVVGNIRYK